MKMVALGPQGTNGHLAALAVAKLLEPVYGETKLHFVRRNEDVLNTVAYLKCLGVVPVSNTVAGLVSGVVTNFWSRQHNGVGVRVIGEYHLPVEHHLLVRRTVRSLSEIEGIASHPHAFPQCVRTLERLGLGHVPRIEVDSTAGAAEMVARNNAMRRVAAIASRKAGEMSELDARAENIHDRKGNTTKFHIIGPYPADPGTKNRTAIIFRMQAHSKDEQRLRGTINTGRKQDALIVRISPENAPESIFYCEFDGHRDRSMGRHILGRLDKRGVAMILGSYPTG